MHLTNLQQPCSKFHAEMSYQFSTEFLQDTPGHREYMSELIKENIVDTYITSTESPRMWMIINARNKFEAEQYLTKSPIYKYLTIHIEPVFSYDGALYMPTKFELN
jgi:hypothetical protein